MSITPPKNVNQILKKYSPTSYDERFSRDLLRVLYLLCVLGDHDYIHYDVKLAIKEWGSK